MKIFWSVIKMWQYTVHVGEIFLDGTGQFSGRGKSGDDCAPHTPDLKYRKAKQIWRRKNYYIQGVFFPVCPRLDQKESCPLDISC